MINSPVLLSYLLALLVTFHPLTRGGPERTGPRPPPWVPLLKNLIMVVVSFPPV